MSIVKYIIICLSFITSCLFSQCNSYEYGDANNDNQIDIIDVVIIVDIIFDLDSINDISHLDLNNDDNLNIIDLVILINRILDVFPTEINISSITFDFSEIYISWEQSLDYGFVHYNIYYSNFFDNEEIMIHSTNNINETDIIVNNLILKEQNFFWIGVEDFLGCELIGQQTLYELPSKEYTLDENGNIDFTEFNINDFNPATDCIDCHTEHYNEWSSSMHSYTMNSPLFFSYKNESNNIHPSTGERFCMQCHNPISYLTGEDLSEYNNFEDFQNSPIDQVLKEGISCDVCHTITGLSQTVHASGNMSANAIYNMYPTGNIKFGPIQNPEPNNFHESYYLPTYKSSQTCLPCHDLVINDVEAEITFTEWNRIPGFSMFGGVSCQDCHMPLKENGYHDHKFIGVDLDLSIPYSENPLHEDVQNLLSTSATIEFNILNDSLDSIHNINEVLSVPLTVTSLTGHNFPTGTSFNREAWIELTVFNNEEHIYSSGKINNDENLNLLDSQLLLFSSYLIDENGENTSNITDFETMENNTLSPYQQRYHNYNINIPNSTVGELIVQARLLFRPFKPNFILEHHPEFINNLPVFVVDEIISTVQVIDE